MRLIDLIGEEAYRAAAAAGQIPHADKGGPDIGALTADSRKVGPGALFAALPGTVQDGRRFVADAVKAGAVAILAPPDIDMTPIGKAAIALITDKEPRRRLAQMAAVFHAGQPECVAAVTGTNGKTSVAVFLRQIWRQLGHNSASLGTLGVAGDGITIPPGPGLTTADPVELHRIMAALAKQQVSHLAMEASSHGLAQYRLDGVRLAAGALTNITHEHLDYHGTMEAYRAAKLRLFDELLPAGAPAVVRHGAPERETVQAMARRRKLEPLTYGIDAGDIRCADAVISETGWTLTLDVRGKPIRTTFPLPGTFQLENALCALALAIGLGADGERAAQALPGMTAVPGRMEIAARRRNGATIIVDYAHTPDALETALTAIRPFTGGRLTVVFGCGGDRDAGKRPVMGEIAARLADRVIVTDDNPRNEEAAAIRRAVMGGCPGAEEIGDRRAAIEAAVAQLGDGDIALVAGKGHETGQLVKGKTLPFDDKAEVRAAVERLEGGVS